MELVKVRKLNTYDESHIHKALEGDLCYGNKAEKKHNFTTTYHIYIESNEAIMKGDYFIDQTGKLQKAALDTELTGKLIGTSDKNLIDVAQVSQSFIKEYCDRDGVDNVLVNFETTTTGQCNCVCHVPGMNVLHFIPCCYPEMVKTYILDEEGYLLTVVPRVYTHDDITHALAYGYSGRRDGLSHYDVLSNYKKDILNIKKQ